VDIFVSKGSSINGVTFWWRRKLRLLWWCVTNGPGGVGWEVCSKYCDVTKSYYNQYDSVLKWIDFS
jgi:hypothetical protein